jgi:hypothetical protein
MSRAPLPLPCDLTTGLLFIFHAIRLVMGVLLLAASLDPAPSVASPATRWQLLSGPFPVALSGRGRP